MAAAGSEITRDYQYSRAVGAVNGRDFLRRRPASDFLRIELPELRIGGRYDPPVKDAVGSELNIVDSHKYAQ